METKPQAAQRSVFIYPVANGWVVEERILTHNLCNNQWVFNDIKTMTEALPDIILNKAQASKP